MKKDIRESSWYVFIVMIFSALLILPVFHWFGLIAGIKISVFVIILFLANIRYDVYKLRKAENDKIITLYKELVDELATRRNELNEIKKNNRYIGAIDVNVNLLEKIIKRVESYL